MSLKDRHAKSQNRKDKLDMVPRNDVHNINVLRGMVPANSVRGAIPKDRGADVNEIRGMVAVEWPSYNDGPQVPKCHATTKKGDPCKASPITDEDYCIGHKRALDASGIN